MVSVVISVTVLFLHELLNRQLDRKRAL